MPRGDKLPQKVLPYPRKFGKKLRGYFCFIDLLNACKLSRGVTGGEREAQPVLCRQSKVPEDCDGPLCLHCLCHARPEIACITKADEEKKPASASSSSKATELPPKRTASSEEASKYFHFSESLRMDHPARFESKLGIILDQFVCPA